MFRLSSSLNLKYNDVKDGCAKRFAISCNFRNITSLTLKKKDIGDSGVTA